MASLKAIAFDFFGVVCPDLATLTGAEFSKRHGLDPVEFSRFGWSFRQALDSGAMSQQEFATKLQKHWNLSSTLAELCAELDQLDGQFYAFDPRLHDLIVGLKLSGLTVVLMSNSSRDEAAYLRNLGAYDIFDRVFISGESGRTKHEVRWFDEVATELNCTPQEILLIDDKAHNVETAKRAGWRESVVYHDVDHLRADLERQELVL